MNILLDTNIVLNIVRARDYLGILSYISSENSKIYLSVVSEAEIRSFSIRKKWGAKKSDFLNGFLDGINIVEVSQLFVLTYAEIDSYSQRSNPNFVNYTFNTPRNMGQK